MIWTKSIPYNLLYPLPYEIRIFTWLHEEPFLHSPRHIMPQNHKPILLWFLFLFYCFCFPLEFADSTCRFFCSIYFAEQFRLLRKRIFADGEEKYELHFVIDYMNRSYGTRKLLYSLIANSVNSDSKAGGDGGGGLYSGRFLVGVWFCVTQFEWDYSSAPVRVFFRQVSSNAARYFSLSSIENLINTYGEQQQFANLQTRREGLEPKCLPQLFLESRLNWPIRSITRV